jgi:hypothetical protein
MDTKLLAAMPQIRLTATVETVLATSSTLWNN